MRACVVVLPGSNSEPEMVRALELVGWEVVRARPDATSLPAGVDLVAIPGGFSYGDYLRAGAIAASSPIVREVTAFAARGGLVLGVCNGFQVLTECGLLPGALARNVGLTFVSREVFVRVDAEGAFLPRCGRVLALPIAHAEGRYHASPEVLRRLEGEGQVALRYVDARGQVGSGGDGPPELAPNPNGSVGDVAGVVGGPKRNVLGLMPHPERAVEPLVGGTDGLAFFEAARDALALR